MAGRPLTRARREAAAKAAQQREDALREARANVRDDVEFDADIQDQLIELIEDGIPIDDTDAGNNDIRLGAASRCGVSASTVHRWKRERPEFAEAVRNARIEATHRRHDKMGALADMAVEEPTKANGIRIGADILAKQSALRNPADYGDNRVATLGGGQ